MKEVYLDHHTATYSDLDVVNVMSQSQSESWAHALQPHKISQKIMLEMQKHYETFYDFIGADPLEDNLIITSSAEEAISHVFHIAHDQAMRNMGKNHFLSLSTEDAAILMNLKNLESLGCRVDYLQQKESSLIDVDQISEAITPRTAMISLSLAHGLLGTIQPIEKLIEICKLRGIYFHLDVSYAAAKMEIDVKKLQPDFLTLSAEPIHGPKNIALLYVRSGIKIKPLIFGGLEQNGYRGGRVDIAALAGFACACEKASEQMSEMCLEIAHLRDSFEAMLSKSEVKHQVLFKNQLRLPNVSVIAFENITSDALLYLLNQKNVFASLGGVQFQKLSYLLEGLGLDPCLRHGAVSFALARKTSLEDIRYAVEKIVEVTQQLSTMTKILKEEPNGAQANH